MCGGRGRRGRARHRPAALPQPHATMSGIDPDQDGDEERRKYPGRGDQLPQRDRMSFREIQRMRG